MILKSLKKYIVDNDLESVAIPLVTKLCESKTDKLYASIKTLKENIVNCNSIYSNKTNSAKELYDLAITLSNFRELTEEEIDKANDIITKDNVTIMPCWFRAYIDICIKGSADEYGLEELERIRRSRDNV